MKTHFFTIACVLLSLSAVSQNKTISEKPKTERELAAGHKVLIIPFEPRLYFSEIDRGINHETSLSAKEIRYKFRDGLDEQLYRAFKTTGYNVLDLMDDTTKYKKDLLEIYQFLGYSYQKVPDQANYQPPKTEAAQKTIEKGQLNVETNSDVRFMNARLNNPKILAQLNGKFKTDVFVFINQLDLKASGSKDPSQMNPNVNRKITVHYTVFNLAGKEINSGVAEEEFEPELNAPKKIIEKYFSKLAAVLVKRVNKGLGMPAK